MHPPLIPQFLGGVPIVKEERTINLELSRFVGVESLSSTAVRQNINTSEPVTVGTTKDADA